MKPEDQRALANKCGLIQDARIDITVQLNNYTAQVEAPLQARIAQLEEALKVAITQNSFDMIMTHEELSLCEKALIGQSTWLSDHDKEVEAKERERCVAACHGQHGFQNCIERIRELKS